MIVLYRHLGRIVPELVLPCIADVVVKGVSVAVEFPDAGHLHVVPSSVIEISVPEISRPFVRILCPEEFPCPVDGHVVGRILRAVRSSLLIIRVCKITCVHRGPVH